MLSNLANGPQSERAFGPTFAAAGPTFARPPTGLLCVQVRECVCVCVFEARRYAPRASMRVVFIERNYWDFTLHQNPVD